MKKRIVSILLAALLLALCGCGAVEKEVKAPEAPVRIVSSAPVSASTMSSVTLVKETETEPEEMVFTPGPQADKDSLKPSDPKANCTEERTQTEEGASKGSKGEPAPTPAPEEQGLKQDVVILSTNDIHCGVTGKIGYDGLAAYKKQLEDEGNYVILVDAGDAVKGDLIGSISKGENIISIMNAVGYDIATPGNHEFDYTIPSFLELAEKAGFSYVSANFMDLRAGKSVFEPYEIVELDGVEIAFVGVSTPSTITSSVPAYFQNENGEFIYNFCNSSSYEPIFDAVQDAVNNAVAEGADYVVAISHLGMEGADGTLTSKQLIASTYGIDAVLDGHSHTVVDSEIVKNEKGDGVILSQCGTKLEYIGQLTISADGEMSSELISEVSGKDASITALIDGIMSEYEEKLGQTVAHSDFDLTIVEPGTDPAVRIVRSGESNLGDLVADAFREVCDADIGFQNGGGVRTSIGSGDISYKDLMSVLPFNNELCVIEATGAQIVDALECAARNIPLENGGFLQASGLSYEIHSYIPSPVLLDENGLLAGFEGEYRVKNVTVGGEPIDLEKTYTVAGTAYVLLNAGDGNSALAGCRVIKDSFGLDSEVFISYVVDTLGGAIPCSYAEPHGDGRITVIPE